MASSHRCPLCGSHLTEAQFERVTKLDAARAAKLHAAHSREQKLASELKRAKLAQKDARKSGEQKGRAFEKARSERLVKGVEKKLTLANERIRQLERGTTPQTEGLEFEDQLVRRLCKEFPDDLIKHEGKGGDVLHTVTHKGKSAGLILYECKRYKTISKDHIAQAARDKRARQADFAVLVTTGARKGFNGLARDGVVLIASPLAVISLAGLLRDQILEIARTTLSRKERERVALGALDFISSRLFAGPLEEAISKTTIAQDLLKQEFRDHMRTWEARWQLYQTIDIDLTNIAANVTRVRDGSKPIALERAKPVPLQLQVVTGAAK
jgi:hypothetical protein